MAIELKNPKICIYAPNIHSGGGAVLLTEMIRSILFSGLKVILVVDDRFECNLNRDIEVIRVRPSILARIKSEIIINQYLEGCCLTIFFGNLPPVRQVNSRSVLYVQNRFLVDGFALKSFANHPSRFRLWCEAVWLRLFHKNVDQLIVQTPSMKRLTSTALKREPFVLPFMSTIPKVQIKKGSQTSTRDFIYVASGELHKNHQRLIEAWEILYSDGVKARLLLTLPNSDFDRLKSGVEISKNIVNLGKKSTSELYKVYNRRPVLIYPSFVESFGLPLSEADKFGLDVIAAERDYVRDVLNPVETFDPESAISIARAVKRYLGVGDVKKVSEDILMSLKRVGLIDV